VGGKGASKLHSLACHGLHDLVLFRLVVTCISLLVAGSNFPSLPICFLRSLDTCSGGHLALICINLVIFDLTGELSRLYRASGGFCDAKDYSSGQNCFARPLYKRFIFGSWTLGLFSSFLSLLFQGPHFLLL
jgi:hypothetical protein